MVKTKNKILNILNKEESIIREVASLLGPLNDLCKGTEYWLAHTKRLEVDKIWGLRRGNNERKVRTSPPSLSLPTDASLLGWGGL